MILLDTNIISETMLPDGDPSVLRWLNAQAPGTLHLSQLRVMPQFENPENETDGVVI